MNKFEEAIRTCLGDEAFGKVQRAKVGIAGLGGLGSNCAVNLVRAGFRKIKIADFDSIDHTNLNRQFYFLDQVGLPKIKALKVNLERINPELQIEVFQGRIEKDNILELFADCDVIVEAFDKAEYKSMLVEMMAPTGKMIVLASGLAGIGNSDEIKVHKVRENLVIVGDLLSDVADSFPISPRVNVAAAKQADVVLEYVVGNGVSSIE